MSTLNINRDRRSLLQSIDKGNVYRSHGGCDMLRARPGAQNQRIERRLRELTGAQPPLAVLGPDERTYVLTGDGERALAGAR